MIEIYIDENLSEYVADALNSLNKGHFIDVLLHSTKIKFGKGKPDEIIIPSIGSSHGIFDQLKQSIIGFKSAPERN